MTQLVTYGKLCLSIHKINMVIMFLCASLTWRVVTRLRAVHDRDRCREEREAGR